MVHDRLLEVTRTDEWRWSGLIWVMSDELVEESERIHHELIKSQNALLPKKAGPMFRRR